MARVLAGFPAKETTHFTHEPPHPRPHPGPSPLNQRASVAAERAAAAAERVADAALAILGGAQDSLEVIRASVVEARAAATASTTESADVAGRARPVQDTSAVSRERYQHRIAGLQGRRDSEGSGGGPADKTDMSAVGDDGQAFGG